ncbi:putative uncharacterized N-acetyltransferase p20 [Iris pallida]|uniref:Uncharacterized N-acetyltransferase p20 n=1 Tax=Iris pallida TaxID=29817 RepID=A0AAX6I1T7_IRIPA|nr:putative uncharacterized N-acetyltransferase p20 [Iris pallida]
MEGSSVEHLTRQLDDLKKNAATPAPPSISLRPFALTDVDDVMVWASDEKASHYTNYDAFTDKQALLEYMKETVLPHPWYRAICVDGGGPVGAVLLKPGADGARDCRKGELGYVVGTAHWGRGIATAAVKAAMGRVFEEVEGLERVEALVAVENKASQRVLEKAGFEREGTMRKYRVHKGSSTDMVMYSFLTD